MSSFEPRLQRFQGGLGQNQSAPPQNVIHVDALDRQHVDIRNVAGGLAEIRCELGTIDDECVHQAELSEAALQLFGLAILHGRLVEHDDAAILGFGRKRVPQGERAYLLGQADLVATRRRAERSATTTEQVDAMRAVAGGAAAFLPRQLLAGAPDLGAILDVMRAGAPLGQLPDDVALDQILARLEPEDLVRQIDRAGIFALERFDLQFHVTRPPARRAWLRPYRSSPRAQKQPTLPAGTSPAWAHPCAAPSSPRHGR